MEAALPLNIFRKRYLRLQCTQMKSFRSLIYGLWEGNPAFRMMLGICSTLVTVSLLRNGTPRRIRMAVYMLIIGTYVIFVDQFLRAYQPTISKAMGP